MKVKINIFEKNSCILDEGVSNYLAFGHIIDTHLVGDGIVVRTAVIFYFFQERFRGFPNVSLRRILHTKVYMYKILLGGNLGYFIRKKKEGTLS